MTTTFQTMDPNVLWASMLLVTLFFTIEASDFPLRLARGEEVMPGTAWMYVKSTGYNFITAICWYIMAAFSIASGIQGTYQFYLLSWGMFFIFVFIGIALTVYLAFRPIVRVIEGEQGLQNG